MSARTPSTNANDLVKVAFARDESEAEFLQNLLRDADVGLVVRRAPGFDVPEFLAAGPRDVLVAASDVPVAQDVLRPMDLGDPEPPSPLAPRPTVTGARRAIDRRGARGAPRPRCRQRVQLTRIRPRAPIRTGGPAFWRAPVRTRHGSHADVAAGACSAAR